MAITWDKLKLKIKLRMVALKRFDRQMINWVSYSLVFRWQK